MEAATGCRFERTCHQAPDCNAGRQGEQRDVRLDERQHAGGDVDPVYET